MTKKEQLKFIEDNYPLYNNHISNRRIRHTFFDTIETELQAYLLGFYAADGSIDELTELDISLIYVVKRLLCCLIYRRFFLRMILM